MASVSEFKEEPFVKGEYDREIVEISSSTNNGNTGGGARAEGTSLSPLLTKRPTSDTQFVNGIMGCAAKRPKVDCNGGGNVPSNHTFFHADPNLVLLDDFLQPLPGIQQYNASIQSSALTSTISLPSLVYPVTDNTTKKIFRQFWKAGDYESDKTGHTSVRGGMDHVRVHPKFLHSNATSHKWALGAIAELLDNALDEVAHGATFVQVDMIRNPRNGEPMLLIEDDGGGMNPDNMRQCMSLGYSEKSKMANTIGQYGNGFKTSTMRLGADVIVFSRCPGSKGSGPTESVGMLSYTFLRETGQEDIIVPMIDYEIQPFGLRKLVRSNIEDWNRNMETLKRWSPYMTEAELLDHFKRMKKQGTKIIVFNLWEDDQGELELDFLSYEQDIQLRGVNRDEMRVSLAKSFPSARHYLTYQHSLRSYASILYLRLPQGFKMYLRGTEIQYHNLVDDLMYTEVWTYRPVGSDVQVDTGQMKAVVTVGFVKCAEQHIDVQGFNVYHKNRLIKPFWRLWNSAASRGRGIFGVLEANFVEPAHDKQGFERTVVLARLETRLVEMQKTYWSKHCHKVGYVNNALKDNRGRPAGGGKGRSSMNATQPAMSPLPPVPDPPAQSSQPKLAPVASVSFPRKTQVSGSLPLPVKSTQVQVSPAVSASFLSPSRLPALPHRATQAQSSTVTSGFSPRPTQGHVSMSSFSPAWSTQMQFSPAASGSLPLPEKVQVPSTPPESMFPPAVTGSLPLAASSTQVSLSPGVSGSLPLSTRSAHVPFSPAVSGSLPLSSRSTPMAVSGPTQLQSSPGALPLPTTSTQEQFLPGAGSLPFMENSFQGPSSDPSCVSVQGMYTCGAHAPASGLVLAGHSRSMQVARPQQEPASRIPRMEPVRSSPSSQPIPLSPSTQPVPASPPMQPVPASRSHIELSALSHNRTSLQTNVLSQSHERLQGQCHSATRSALPLPVSSSLGMQSESDRHVASPIPCLRESDENAKVPSHGATIETVDYHTPITSLPFTNENLTVVGQTSGNNHVIEASTPPSVVARVAPQNYSSIKSVGFLEDSSIPTTAEFTNNMPSRGLVASEASFSVQMTKQFPLKEIGLHGSYSEQNGQASISTQGVAETRSIENSALLPCHQRPLKWSNKGIALGRKSLEDLGRMFAKKAAEISMNPGERSALERGPDAGAIVCSTSQSIATTLNTETHVKELEMELKLLQQRLETVTMERDDLKRRLFEERLQGQRSKQELEKKVEETWAKLRELEVQNEHLRLVQQ